MTIGRLGMERRFIEGKWQKKNRAFSPAVVTKGGTTIWLAGHGAIHDDYGETLAGDFDAQTHQAFKFTNYNVVRNRRKTNQFGNYDRVYIRCQIRW